MPQSITFDGVTNPLSHPECTDLPTMIQFVPFGEKRTVQITSCWQFSPEEIIKLQRNGGKFFISLMGSQPPIIVSMEKPTLEMREFSFEEIAKRLKDEFDSARLAAYGDEGRVYLTFPDMQFDLSKEEWARIQDLFSEL